MIIVKIRSYSQIFGCSVRDVKDLGWLKLFVRSRKFRLSYFYKFSGDCPIFYRRVKAKKNL